MAFSNSARLLARSIGLLALCLILVYFPAPLAHAQSASNVTINSSEQLFSVMAALNMAGYDTGLYASTGNNTRREVRDDLAKEKTPIVPQIAQFYAAHHNANNPGLDFGQYVSLALLLGPPPDFKFTVAVQDLPPDASAIRDF